MMEVIKVGIADSKVASNSEILRTAGLGSCVGVTLYDRSKKVGGMVHIMLPESPENKEFKKAKYADTGIAELIEIMEKKGANKSKLEAKMAGGAQMFSFQGKEKSELLKIGERNAKACEDVLKKENIRIVAKDTGGTQGRTIELYCKTGKLLIKTIKEGVKEV